LQAGPAGAAGIEARPFRGVQPGGVMAVVMGLLR